MEEKEKRNFYKYLILFSPFWLAVILTFFSYSNIFSARVSSMENLLGGKRYKTIKPIYIMGVYDNTSNKTLSRQTAQAYLYEIKLATRSYTAFQSEVPTGTVIVFISQTSRPWYHFSTDTYHVRLDPDLSHGLDVEIELNRGLGGSLDGLNSEIFVRE